MPGHVVLAANITFGGSDPLTTCFSYLFAGAIAGTVASFIVRGKLGCLLGNFVLGILGAIAAQFILNFLLQFITLPHSNTIPVGFIGTTIIASIAATLIALIFNAALKAERSHQEKLLEQHRQERGQG